ncbi:MAG: pilus assembly protein PilM [Syntrophales bacterium]|nr:pilus assembly protein PilM [Syntrophales bacterium]
MPERILGLDIGGGSVKAVLLSHGFRGGYRVLGFRRIDTAAAGGLTEALEQLFAGDAFRGAVCVTALHAGMLSFRHIRLPFRDDRKIRQTLAFALEPVIQTPLEEVFIDYTHAGGAGESEIFAALAPRTLVGERTELLKPYVRETAVIDISAVSLTLRLTRNIGGPETILLLDVGGRDTTAVFACEGRILHIRHFPFGGETATRAMATALNSDSAEAEAVKRSGEIPPAASAAIDEVCRHFCIELINTRKSLIWQGAIPQSPALVLLTGGGSRTPGLEAILTESFSAPVEQADLLAEGDIQIEETLRQSWDPAVMDQALALAARPMVKGSGFNFRQLASEARAGYGEFRDRLKKGVMAAVIILILAGVEIGLDDYGSRLHLDSLRRDITAEFKKSYPEATRVVDPVAQLRGKIAEARKLSAGMGDAMTEATVLDLLREISGFAPANLLLTAFSLDGDAIGLKGEARNFEAVDAFKKAFANSKFFKTVTIGSTSMMKQGSGVEFDLKVTLKK